MVGATAGDDRHLREAYRARLNHALANHEIVAGKGSLESTRARARLINERAARATSV